MSSGVLSTSSAKRRAPPLRPASTATAAAAPPAGCVYLMTYDDLRPKTLVLPDGALRFCAQPA